MFKETMKKIAIYGLPALAVGVLGTLGFGHFFGKSGKARKAEKIGGQVFNKATNRYEAAPPAAQQKTA